MKFYLHLHVKYERIISGERKQNFTSVGSKGYFCRSLLSVFFQGFFVAIIIVILLSLTAVVS